MENKYFSAVCSFLSANTCAEFDMFHLSNFMYPQDKTVPVN